MEMEKRNLEKEIVVPMGADSHLGAVRAVYPVKNAYCVIHGAHGCDYQSRLFLSCSAGTLLPHGSSGMRKPDVIYGGEEVLEKTLYEVIESCKPRLLVVQATCIPSLIGDDVEGVANKVGAKTGTKIIVTWNPNYKGTQLDGFVNTVNKYVTEVMEPPKERIKKTVNILGSMPGEHNSRNDVKELARILTALGLHVHCVLLEKGTTLEQLKTCPQAEANVLFYPEVGLPTARLMQEKYDQPYVETEMAPVGIEATKEWIMRIAEHFDVVDRAREFIEAELQEMGHGLFQLWEGEIYHLQVLFGKPYAINAVSYRLPAMVKFLAEDFSMVPSTIGIQEFDSSSYDKLIRISHEKGLEPDIIENGDYLKFMYSVKKEFEYPRGKPQLLFGNTIDAWHLYFTATRLPIIRYSFPVMDENIIQFSPFVGFKGVVVLAEKMWNIFQGYTWGTLFPGGGYIPGHYDLHLEDIIKKYESTLAQAG